MKAKQFLGKLVVVLTLFSTGNPTMAYSQNEETLVQTLFDNYEVPQWYKDAKFGIWLHWGPQSIPLEGGGWYARHMYMDSTAVKKEPWGKGAWEYHRKNYGHQSEFGYKDLCNSWKAEKFDADQMVKQFKTWGAKYVAVIANHHDNFDLFNSSVHPWNSTKVGPKRDIVGEFSRAAIKNKLKWVATVHVYRAKGWLAPAFGADKSGEKAGVPYDGNLTIADGKGKWWDGMNPQQFYATNYPDFEKELTIRHLELVEHYKPDILYFDDSKIPEPIMLACQKLYLNSYKKNGSNQAVITVKSPEKGTVRDVEKGVSEGLLPKYWQSETTLAEDWFFKPKADGSSQLRHNVRSLKELLVDVISKRGSLMVNVAVGGDGSIPQDQFKIMNEFGQWLKANSEAIYGTEPWKIYGEGGEIKGGHFNERGIESKPWDSSVFRFTRDKKNKILYVYIFGNQCSNVLLIKSLAERKQFAAQIKHLSLIGSNQKIHWELTPNGLSVEMPNKLPYQDCNVLKIKTTNLD